MRAILVYHIPGVWLADCAYCCRVVADGPAWRDVYDAAHLHALGHAIHEEA